VWKVAPEPQALTPDMGDPLDLLDPGHPLDPLLGSFCFILDLLDPGHPLDPQS